MGRYSADLVQKAGYTAVELTDSACGGKAEIVPDIGNNLLSFECGGIPVIVPPGDMHAFITDSKFHTWFGIPILFPPNRITEGRFHFDGQDYQLPINEPPHHLHGDLSRKPWEIAEYGATDERGAYLICRFDFNNYPEIMAYFPHALSFSVTYTLYEGRLDMQISAENKGETAAPFAFGLHPYFAIPAAAAAESVLIVPAAEEWPVNNQAFVTGEPSATDFCESLRQGIAVADYPELGCSLITLDSEDRVCRFEMKEAGCRIAYEIDAKFPFVVLFKPSWAEAFSIEPYTYVTDAFNLPYPHELTGVRKLEPGEVLQFTNGIWLESSGKAAAVQTEL